MAARGQFSTPSRLPALFLTLQRNASSGRRSRCRPRAPGSSFPGSELVYQLYPGHGLQIQWLGTFGKLNGYWSGGKRYDARAGALLDEINAAGHRARGRARVGVPVPVRRPEPAVGLLAGPGHGPAGDGALRDAAAAPGRRLPDRAARAGIFQTAPPAGVRVRRQTARTTCSTPVCRGCTILNGFVQSLVGLYDFAALTGDPTARSLFDDGDLAARERCRPSTPAPGRSTARLDHPRVRPRLPQAPARLPRRSCASARRRSQYCSAEQHFTPYLTTPPALAGAAAHLTAEKSGKLRSSSRRSRAITYDQARREGRGHARPGRARARDQDARLDRAEEDRRLHRRRSSRPTSPATRPPRPVR